MEKNYLITLYKLTKNVIEKHCKSMDDAPKILENKSFKKLHIKIKKWIVKSNKIKLDDLDEISELFCYLYEVIYKKYFNYDINEYFLKISLIFKDMDPKDLELFWELWLDIYALQWLWYQVYSNNVVYSEMDLEEINNITIINIKKSLFSCLINLVFVYDDQGETKFAREVEKSLDDIENEDSIKTIYKKMKIKIQDDVDYNIISIIKNNNSDLLNKYFLNEVLKHYHLIINSIYK